jgi:hypothetical protein
MLPGQLEIFAHSIDKQKAGSRCVLKRACTVLVQLAESR